jgi:hypothetical protein
LRDQYKAAVVNLQARVAELETELSALKAAQSGDGTINSAVLMSAEIIKA